MFFPQEMTEVELIVPEKDLLTVTRLLSGQGNFHQADATYLTTDKASSSANLWQEKASAALENMLPAALSKLLDEFLAVRIEEQHNTRITQPSSQKDERRLGF